MVGVLPAFSDGILLINDGLMADLILGQNAKKIEKHDGFNCSLWAGFGASSMINKKMDKPLTKRKKYFGSLFKGPTLALL